ncbi:anti-sigma factor [Bhargavaea cecembensis]|uniref:Anti-sigma factor n=2 Tax=Bhargavaea cecembensis TaxID=394098 RepID=A0A163GJJ0_9BACL|nr:anti-sigma factor [Bhargavaea cecembensis]
MSAARWKLILTILTVALLIVPTGYMLTFAYYAFGTKSTTLMDTASNVLYLTEPNTALKELEFDMDFSLFSMDLSFDQYKQIGNEHYPVRHYDLHFVLDDLVDKEMTSNLDRTPPKYPTETNQWLVHPAQGVPEFNSAQEWQVLAGLPDETVVEAYVSFNDLYKVIDIRKELRGTDVLWAAIYTGTEDEMLSTDGYVVSPIGYPVQPDQTYWSPFRDSMSHEETFLQLLKEIEPYEELAAEVSSHKNLKLKERIAFIEENGFAAYGAVITGPKQEVEALKDSELIRHMKLGEVKLWNWTK